MALTVSLPGAFARMDGAAAPKADPGLTRGQILIGGTFPLTGRPGALRADSEGMDAYFKWVNQRKGLTACTRDLRPQDRLEVLRRRLQPANTVQLTNQLVLQDKVFAIVGTLGTEPNIPIRPLLNQRKVPQVFVSTGASYWGLQYKQYPWTSGWQPDSTSRGNRVWALDRTECAEREDRSVLPERRLRQGLPQGPQDRARREAELRCTSEARLRDHGHEPARRSHASGRPAPTRGT